MLCINKLQGGKSIDILDAGLGDALNHKQKWIKPTNILNAGLGCDPDQ